MPTYTAPRPAAFKPLDELVSETRRLEPMRQRKLEEPDVRSQALAALDKADPELSGEDVLKSMPRGFGGASDHEHADSSKIKRLMVRRSLDRKT